MTNENWSSPLAPLPWMERAVCASTDPDVWFPTKALDQQTEAKAKRICHRCPVIDECLEYALESDQRYGIWGGLSEQERRGVARRRRA